MDKNPIDIYVGSRVRLRRQVLSISQEKLSEKLGLTFQQVQKYEKGTNRIGASRLYEISKILDVPIQFFYDGLKTGKSDLNIAADSGEDVYEHFMSSPEAVSLCHYFSQIKDETVRKKILDLVKSISV